MLRCCSPAASPQPGRTKDPALARGELLRQVPLVDGHNDLPWELREAEAPGALLPDLRLRRAGDTDIPRLREGELAGQFWSVYVPSEMAGASRATQLEQIDIARRMIAKYPDVFELATARGRRGALHKRQGRIASLLGMEGGHAIENSPRRAARLLRARRPLHDAHPQRDPRLGRLPPRTPREHGGLTRSARRWCAR